MEPPKRKPKVHMFRFLRCFKPSGVVSRERKTPDPLLTYIAVPEKHMFPTVLTSAFTAAKGGEGNASHWKKTDRNKNDDGNNNSNLSFRRALMSAFNHTSLGKKMSRKRKTKKDDFSRESSKNLSNYSSYSSIFTTTSSPSSTSTTLSTISTGTVTSTTSCEPCLTRSLAMANGTRMLKHNRKHGSNIAVTVFFITALLVLILWGRCYAIAYTAIGFFVVPSRRRTSQETELISSVRFKK
ncbi:uncharacterized protein LOC111240769 [Vigna radiata var. radiata]|uniref:Uncharacterized protein LOC111240769 n=1 Tax=Vigna radiata var. radiata TaxID=3916 RepID=A0A3Q0EPN8_VIGRR|nr:uncharacterized protein LOC111240769 [Vigna radiata var. radiata]